MVLSRLIEIDRKQIPKISSGNPCGQDGKQVNGRYRQQMPQPEPIFDTKQQKQRRKKDGLQFKRESDAEKNTDPPRTAFQCAVKRKKQEKCKNGVALRPCASV